MPFCHKCGAKLEEGDMFCVECGTKVRDSKPALTDNTNSKNLAQLKPNTKKEKIPLTAPQKMKSSKESTVKYSKENRKLLIQKPVFVLIAVLSVFLIVSLIIVIISLRKKSNSVQSEVRYIDANNYFNENSEIKSVVSAKKARNDMTEMRVLKELKSRGLSVQAVTTNYSINGSLIETKEISEKSSEKHPIYETYYITSKDEVWVINVIDGVITALPSVYNTSHRGSVPVIISETEEIASYDCSTNSFYRTIPKSTALKVRIVSRIDASTLESFDLEG